jgi:hypothetical protein
MKKLTFGLCTMDKKMKIKRKIRNLIHKILKIVKNQKTSNLRMEIHSTY